MTRTPNKLSVESFGLNSYHGRPLPMTGVQSHAEVELNWIEAGAISYRMGGETVTLKAGTLAVFSAATAHGLAAAPSPKTRYFWITVPFPIVLEWNLPTDLARALWRGRVVTSTTRGDRQLFEQWHADLQQGGRDRIVLLEIQARLERLALQFSDATTRPSRAVGSNHVAAMVRVILEHFREPLRASDIAEPTGLDPDTAGRLFRKEIGLSPREFLIRQRLAHAQQMLEGGDEKVTTIAANAGFATLSRFYEAFTREFGVSPQRMRRRGATEDTEDTEKRRRRNR